MTSNRVNERQVKDRADKVENVKTMGVRKSISRWTTMMGQPRSLYKLTAGACAGGRSEEHCTGRAGQ